MEQGISQKQYFILVALLLFCVALFVSGGVYYFYLRNHQPAFLSTGNEQTLPFLSRTSSDGRLRQIQPEDRYYMPKTGLSPALKQAITHYQEKRLRQAKAALETIVNSMAPDKQKAVALTYLGIIAMNRDNFPLARHYLLNALRHDSESVGALVNLSILERLVNNYAVARDYALQAKKLAPEDSHVLLLLGNLLLEKEEADAAITTYEKAISGLERDVLIHYNLGLAHLRKGNTESAIQNFKLVDKETTPTSLRLRAQAQLGQIYFTREQLDLAADYLLKAVRLAPENSKYLYNLGVVYLRKKQKQEALTYFQRCLQTEQVTPKIYRSLAQALVRLEKPQLAIVALQKTLRIHPKDLDALFQLAELQYQLADLTQAEEAFQKIVEISPVNSNTQQALHRLAEIYLDMERYGSAINVLEKAIQLQAQNPQAYFLLGKVYEKYGKSELAIATWKKALTLQSPLEVRKNSLAVPTKEESLLLEKAAHSQSQKLPLTYSQEHRIRLALAQLYQRQGAYDLAIKQYHLLQEHKQGKNPTLIEDTQLHLALAKAYMATKNFKNAIQYLKPVSNSTKATFEQRREAFVQLARAYIYRGQDAESTRNALVSINNAVSLDSDHPQTRLEQAWVLLKTQTAINREKALEVLTALIHSIEAPNLLTQAYNLMGLVYLENGEYRRALTAFDYSLQLDSTNREAQSNRRTAVNAHEKSLQKL